MQVTAGIHIDKSGRSYDNVVYHNARKKRIFNDKNKHINWNLTKYNQIGKLHDADKLLENNAKSYVTKYNQRQIKQGHRKRSYSSVHQYIQKRAGKAKRRGIIWLGNSQFRTKFENRAIRNLKPTNPNWTDKQLKFYLRTKFEPRILKRELINFNKEHKHIKICRYAIHTDEDFIHAHVELVALPSYTKTKVPRPSFSMSKAIREEYPNAQHTFHTRTKYYGKKKSKKKILHGTFTQPDGRKALHLLDDNVGKSLIRAYHVRNLGLGDLTLTRTGNVSSLSGDQYKQYASASDKVSEMTSKAQSASIEQSTVISELNSTFSSQSSVSAEIKRKTKSLNTRLININNIKDNANTSLNQKSMSIDAHFQSLASSVSASSKEADGYLSAGKSFLSNSTADLSSSTADLASSASNTRSTAYSEANSLIHSATSSANASLAPKLAKINNFNNFLLNQLATVCGIKDINKNPKIKKIYLNNVTGKASTKIDGKKRYGIDLITHIAAWDIMHGKRIQNTRTVAHNFKNYQYQPSSSANKYAMNSSEASSYYSSIASAQSSRRAAESGSGSEIQ